jgi:hypothetical protein
LFYFSYISTRNFFFKEYRPSIFDSSAKNAPVDRETNAPPDQGARCQTARQRRSNIKTPEEADLLHHFYITDTDLYYTNAVSTWVIAHIYFILT